MSIPSDVNTISDFGAVVPVSTRCTIPSLVEQALQAATGGIHLNLELIQYLLNQGAYIDARPAVEGGVTALQGAAIRGGIKVAKLSSETAPISFRSLLPTMANSQSRELLNTARWIWYSYF